MTGEMMIAQALEAGLDFATALHAPVSLVEDIVAAHMIEHHGFERELTGQDAEEDFLRVMSAK